MQALIQEEYATVPPRVCDRSNKGKPPVRYSREEVYMVIPRWVAHMKEFNFEDFVIYWVIASVYR